MAYTFFKSRNMPVGKSLVEDDRLDSARAVTAKAEQRGVRLELPVDHVVAPKLEAGAPAEVLAVADAAIGERMGLDIGPKTAALYAEVLTTAKTVIWNGPMGVFEIPEFAKGTEAVARAVAAVEGTTIIGGGDSISAINKVGVADQVSHISTGGGASLEFLGGQVLPGVAALTDKQRNLQSCRSDNLQFWSSAMRHPFIAGNWKMHKTVHEAVVYVKEFRSLVKDIEDVEIVVAPPSRRFTPAPKRRATRRSASPARISTGRSRAPSPARSARRWCARPAPTT